MLNKKFGEKPVSIGSIRFFVELLEDTEQLLFCSVYLLGS